MELQIPTVKIDAEMKAPTNTAQIQTVHSNYDESVMATKSLAALVGAVNDFKVAHDATIANEARLEISTLNATELTDFQVNNNNPEDGDLDKAKESLAAKQQKILDKYGIDDLDLRVRNRFNADLKGDNARFESNVASSMIEKRYKANLRLYNTQISSNINEAQMYYNNPKAIEKSTRLAMEALEAKGKMEGWTDEEFEYQRLKIHSAIQLTVGLTAAKKGNYALVEQIVNTQHKNMIDDEWRKLASMYYSHLADEAVKKSKIDPVFSIDLAVKERMAAYPADYIASEAAKNGVSVEVQTARLEAQEYRRAMDQVAQQNRESDVKYQPVARAIKWLKLYKDRDSVKNAVTIDEKIQAAIGEHFGINSTDTEHPDYQNAGVQEALAAFKQVQDYDGYRDIVDQSFYGSYLPKDDAHQASVLKTFNDNIDPFCDMTNSQFEARLRGEMGANQETLNKAYVARNEHRAKRQLKRDKDDINRMVNTYLLSNSNGTYDASTGKYDLLIPNEIKKAMKTLGESKVNTKADKLFKNNLISSLMEVTGSDNLTTALQSLRTSPELLMDKDGNLKPYVVECIDLTKEQLSLEFGIAIKNGETPLQLKPSEMPYAARAYYGVTY